MMGILKTTTLLLIIIFSSCNAQQEDNEIIELIYSAQTRGSYLNITFDDKSLLLKSTDGDKTVSLTKEQTVEILEEISKINTAEISNLKAPSNKRFSDGALSANFTIKKDNETYISSEFDHGNPPEEFRKLYDILNKLTK